MGLEGFLKVVHFFEITRRLNAYRTGWPSVGARWLQTRFAKTVFG